MSNYVTIYIDKLLEKELYKNTNILTLFEENGLDKFKKQIDFTHAFLGLTRKHPDELDTLEFERDIMYWDYKLGKMVKFRTEKVKWYEKFENVEFNDGFWGFGSGTSGFWNSPGKVFSNNHYLVDNNTQTNTYNIKRLRSTQTFKPSNRCTLEISQEQYETLLSNIKKDFETTREIKPQSLKPINEEFSYNLYANNCVHWVIKKLFDIGIEVIDETYTIPGNFMKCFPYFKFLHSIFLKFQNIDENLETIKGAIAFRDWARMMIGNHYICYVDEQIIENKTRAYCKKDIESEIFYIRIKNFYTKEQLITSIYNKLNTMLNQITSKLNNENLKGDFKFIYWDGSEGKAKILDKEHDYKAYGVDTIDLTLKENHYAVSKSYPFIFTPKDEMHSRMLYHKYAYKVCDAYQRDRNEFYRNILAGIQSDKHWSFGYHKMMKRLKLNQQFEIKELEKV